MQSDRLHLSIFYDFKYYLREWSRAEWMLLKGFSFYISCWWNLKGGEVFLLGLWSDHTEQTIILCILNDLFIALKIVSRFRWKHYPFFSDENLCNKLMLNQRHIHPSIALLLQVHDDKSFALIILLIATRILKWGTFTSLLIASLEIARCINH